MKEIVEIVAAYYKVWLPKIYAHDRKTDVRKARQISMYLVRQQMPKVSILKVAEHFKKTHATIIHAVKAVENDMATNEEYRIEVKELLWKTKSIDAPPDLKICNQRPFEIKKP